MGLSAAHGGVINKKLVGYLCRRTHCGYAEPLGLAVAAFGIFI
jgi:hypothetical protein